MFQCLNRPDPDCRLDAGELSNIIEVRSPDKETRLWPPPQEIEKADATCRQCPKAILEIKERKCPICGSADIVSGFIQGAGYAPISSSNILYPYKCSACGESLFSYKLL